MGKLDKSFFLNTFKAETEDHIKKLNKKILDLRGEPGNDILIKEIMRELHTMKGAAGMIGFKPIVRITHGLEDLISALMEKKISMSVIDDLVFDGFDSIEMILDAEIKGEEYPIDIEKLIRDISDITGKKYVSEKKPLETEDVKSADTVKITQQTEESKSILHVEDTIRISTSKLDILSNIVGELIVNQVKFKGYTNNIFELQELQKKFGKIFNDISKRSKEAGNETNALDDEKLTDINRFEITELEFMEKFNEFTRQFNETADSFSKQTDHLLNIVLNMRMLPISSVFDLFPRTVYDIAKKFNKDVDLQITGSETEIDPHMRNDVFHRG